MSATRVDHERNARETRRKTHGRRRRDSARPGGDLDAYEVLVARYTPVAHRTAYLLGAGHEAEDVVQEAFVKAFRGLARFREDASFRPWLLRIVTNETRNLRRSWMRRSSLETRVALRDPPTTEPDDPEVEALTGETRTALLDAVRALPEKDRQVVTCRYFLDLSEGETAQVLGWPRGSVKSRLSRALARLRPVLAVTRTPSEGRTVAERDDAVVEAALRDLGRGLDVPSAPDLTGAVRTRLAGSGSTRHRAWLPRVAVAVMVALLAVSVTLTVSPAARAAFIELLRFAGVEIRQGPTPDQRPGGQPAEPSPQQGSALPTGRSVTLAKARTLAEFPIYVPSALGRPDEVRVRGGMPPRVVSLLYRPGPGLPEPSTGAFAVRLDQFHAASELYFQKLVAMGKVQQATVEGHPAIWIEGPHSVRYIGPDGMQRSRRARPAANTLIWQAGGVTLRLEGRFTKTEALDVARSVGHATPRTDASNVSE